jgi:hypothetical protein
MDDPIPCPPAHDQTPGVHNALTGLQAGTALQGIEIREDRVAPAPDALQAVTLRQSAAVLALSLCIAAVLLCSRLSVIPGLHGDEAWAGLRAHAIWNGERSLKGMNEYTGPVYEFLMAPWLGLLGYRVFALRLPTSMASLLTAVLYHRVIGRLFGPATAALATMTLVSLPFFTAFGRLAGENFALNPVLAVGSVLLLLDSGSASRGAHGPAKHASVRLFCSGLCMGLGTWNHAIFGSVPLAVAAAAFQRGGMSLVRRTSTYAVGAGCLIALVPRVLIQLTGYLPPDPGQPASALPEHAAPLDLLRHFLHGLLNRLSDWPGLFLQIAHGDILYRRFAGELALSSPNLLAVLVGAGFISMWTMRTPGREGDGRARALQVTVFGSVLFASTLVICPGNSDRYFLLPLYLIPVYVAAVFERLWNAARLKGPSGWPLWIFAIFIGFQLTRTAFDYFASQERSHGRASILLLGRQAETSNHTIRTDGLYRQLVALGATSVSAEFFIAEPLRFYDLERRHFLMVSIDEQTVSGPTPQSPPGSYAVFYSGGLRRNLPERYRALELVSEDAQFVVKRQTSHE